MYKQIFLSPHIDKFMVTFLLIYLFIIYLFILFYYIYIF